jgi:hypothetical protein
VATRAGDPPAAPAGTPGHAVIASGKPASPHVSPGERGTLDLGLPASWRDADALYLTATDARGRAIHTWTWMTRGPADVRPRVVHLAPTGASGVAARDEGGTVVLEAAGVRATIDRATGQLSSLEREGRRSTFANGPRIVDGRAKLLSLTHESDGSGQVVLAQYEGELKQVRWRLDASGWLELSYRYANPGRHANLGVSFDFPEQQVTGLRWLGRGPYRVWKNRIQGTSFDVWQKAYNDTRTGADWAYPEFKGHHAGLYWATLEARDLPLTVVTDSDGLFLRLFTPRSGVDPQHTAVTFPEGDISFLHGITAIGTKFNDARDLGPSGQTNESVAPHPTQHMGDYEARLFFWLGPLPR